MTIATWVAARLKDAEEVEDIDVLAANVIRVSRSEHPPFLAGIVSAARVEGKTIQSLVEGEHDIEIIANVPKDAFWTGDALSLASRHQIASGVFGDLRRVLTLGNVRSFVPAETAFIERGLGQHRRVASFHRLHDRVYQIHLHNADQSDVVAVMLNEYELTAEHIRAARDRYGPFAIVVKTNPNGRPTTSAVNVARQLSVDILMWGEFLGRLNAL